MITLATLSQASPQQVFNQVKKHLLKQKQACRTDDTCLYKNGKLKCAAGCLISDEEYKPEFENNDWTGLIDKFKITPCHEDLIMSLQAVHDEEHPDDWKKCLEQVAEKYQLKFK
jgi:hypothetical protein